MTTPKPITTPVAQLQSVKPRDGGYAADKTLRDEIAIAAMQGAISEGALRSIANLIREQDDIDSMTKRPVCTRMTDIEIADATNAQLAIRCYAIADAMLAAREESE